jgi:hypothetical protein
LHSGSRRAVPSREHKGDNRDTFRLGAKLCYRRRWSRDDHVGFELNKFFSQRRQSIHYAEGPLGHDLVVLPFHIPKFAQAPDLSLVLRS